MRYETLRNHKIAAVSAIDSLFARAKICGMRASEITAAFQSILADHSGIPNHAREYLRGRFDVQWESLYRESLMFGGFCNGEFYSTHSSRPDYYAKHGIDPSEWAQRVGSGMVRVGHYWKTTATPKPFSDMESE